MKGEEKITKVQIAKIGGKKKLNNLTLLFNPKLTFLGILLKILEFFILTFDDSFNWSKQFMVSDNNEFPIFILRGLTSGLELFRTIL